MRGAGPAQEPTIVARAPGKLLLSGEYAVLEGAPAVVLAVDREAEARLTPRQRWPGTLHAPELDAHMSLDPANTDVDPASDPETTGLGPVGAVCRAELAAAELVPFDLETRTGPLYQGGRKLGLGSSAAVCAAVQAAIAAHAGRPPEPVAARFNRIAPVYRAALGGDASGADLAAALCGGVLAYRAGPKGPSIRPLQDRLPPLLGVWTGVAAASTAFVARYRDWRRAEPEASLERLNALVALAGKVPDAVVNGDYHALAAVLGEYRDRVGEIGRAMGAETFTAEHRRIAGLADKSGVFYKPAGAGGGDLGLALGSDPDILEDFRVRVAEAGFGPLKLSIQPEGARCLKPGAPAT